ncbi:LysR family transcriptional regulator [Arthrobacter sp.]|uniref:LysR family transcriptional regulator n=1 Tax=Arthrobacter sp. TaxID=1667 RepID=UPI003A92B78D
MELKHLKAFAVVAEELHFGRAADRLGIAQPQLSQWVKRLEADLGAPLFSRNTRSVHLTQQGEAILKPARQTIDWARRTELAVLANDPEVFGKVRIGYAGASSREVLPAIARAIRAAEPGIELDLRSMVYGGHAPGLVAAGELEIGFSRLPLHQSSVHGRVFAFERVLVALPADHRLAALDEVPLAELAHEPWVSFPATKGSNVRDMGLRLAHETGFTPRIAQEAPDSYAILGLVAAGVGVSLTVSSVRHIETPGLVYRDLAGEPSFLAAIIIWGDAPDRATRRVLEIMEGVLPTPEKPAGRVLD